MMTLFQQQKAQTWFPDFLHSTLNLWRAYTQIYSSSKSQLAAIDEALFTYIYTCISISSLELL